jgi:hypothetical protein
MNTQELHDLAVKELGERIERGNGSHTDLILAGLIVNFGELRDNLKRLNDTFMEHSKITNSSFEAFQELLGDSKERATELLELTKKQMELCDKNCSSKGKSCDNCYYGEHDKSCPEDNTTCGDFGNLHKWKPKCST